jgi:spore coat polysaccharide biosynthesis protein SpsF
VTTHVVIQARTGSARLPGKVLADLCGRPLLAHVVDRARRGRSVDAVVVATTTEPGDDAVVDLCGDLGVVVVRGSVDDVLTRYVEVQRTYPADVVVRVTADCPLLDWRLLDRVVGALRRSGADYASNVVPQTYPDGYDVEAFTATCLDRLDGLARRPYEREHVTANIREHPDQYVIARVTCRRDLSWMRLTVDVPSDLERIRAILDQLPPSPPPRLSTVLALLRRHPELASSPGDPARDAAYHAQRLASLQECVR